MVKLWARQDCDVPAWNAQVERLGGAVHHTSEWIEFTAHQSRATPVYVEGTDDQGRHVVAALYIARPAIWPYSHWATCEADALPIASEVGTILSHIEDLMRSRGCVDLKLGSFAAVGTLGLRQYGYEEARRLEFVLRLDSGIEQAWRGFRATQRNEIKKFDASGAECLAATDSRSIETFSSIQEATIKRHVSKGKMRSRTDPTMLHSLWDKVVRPGRARVYFALKDGIALSTALVGRCGQRSYLIYSGSTPEGFALYASKGLLWHVLKTEYEAGMREFNLGGIPAGAQAHDSVNHGLFRFKQGFGAEARVCIGGHKILRPVAAGCRNTSRRIVAFFRKGLARPPRQDVV